MAGKLPVVNIEVKKEHEMGRFDFTCSKIYPTSRPLSSGRFHEKRFCRRNVPFKNKCACTWKSASSESGKDKIRYLFKWFKNVFHPSFWKDQHANFYVESNRVVEFTQDNLLAKQFLVSHSTCYKVMQGGVLQDVYHYLVRFTCRQRGTEHSLIDWIGTCTLKFKC